jgi:hypothetical protein
MSAILAQTYDDAVAVTPSDTTPQANTSPFAGLLVVSIAGGANLSFITPSGTTVNMVGVTTGTEIHVRVKQVKSTGTTATVVGLVAMPYKGQL